MKRLLFVLLILPLMLIAGCVGQMTLGWGTPPTYTTHCCIPVLGKRKARMPD